MDKERVIAEIVETGPNQFWTVGQVEAALSGAWNAAIEAAAQEVLKKHPLWDGIAAEIRALKT